MEAFILIIYLRANIFCDSIKERNEYCIETLVECYLDDNKQWCEDAYKEGWFD